MKCIALTICLGLLLFSFTSCKKSSNEPEAFNYEQAAGIWVPYEILLEDGSIQKGPFTSASHFGVYAESVQLNKDLTFVPVVWESQINYKLKQDEKGTYKYSAADVSLIFNGYDWNNEYKITKFTSDELWLNVHNSIYRLKKQL
jgi:hypothetical protein